MPKNHEPAKSDSTPDAEIVHTELSDPRRAIELRAYYLFCERGCGPGRDVDDWLTAEQEVLTNEGESPEQK